MAVKWQVLTEEVKKYGITNIGTASLRGGELQDLNSVRADSPVYVYSVTKWWHDTQGRTPTCGYKWILSYL